MIDTPNPAHENAMQSTENQGAMAPKTKPIVRTQQDFYLA